MAPKDSLATRPVLFVAPVALEVTVVIHCKTTDLVGVVRGLLCSEAASCLPPLQGDLTIDVESITTLDIRARLNH